MDFRFSSVHSYFSFTALVVSGLQGCHEVAMLRNYNYAGHDAVFNLYLIGYIFVQFCYRARLARQTL